MAESSYFAAKPANGSVRAAIMRNRAAQVAIADARNGIEMLANEFQVNFRPERLQTIAIRWIRAARIAFFQAQHDDSAFIKFCRSTRGTTRRIA